MGLVRRIQGLNYGNNISTSFEILVNLPSSRREGVRTNKIVIVSSLVGYEVLQQRRCPVGNSSCALQGAAQQSLSFASMIISKTPLVLRLSLDGRK